LHRTTPSPKDLYTKDMQDSRSRGDDCETEYKANAEVCFKVTAQI